MKFYTTTRHFKHTSIRNFLQLLQIVFHFYRSVLKFCSKKVPSVPQRSSLTMSTLQKLIPPLEMELNGFFRLNKVLAHHSSPIPDPAVTLIIAAATEQFSHRLQMEMTVSHACETCERSSPHVIKVGWRISKASSNSLLWNTHRYGTHSLCAMLPLRFMSSHTEILQTVHISVHNIFLNPQNLAYRYIGIDSFLLMALEH